jgi:hypothetical protein
MAKAKTSSMTYECRDWTGKTNTVEVKGDIILSHPESHIYLARLSKHTYRVHYGLQHKFWRSLEDAVADFGNCFLHACECDGIELRKEHS